MVVSSGYRDKNKNREMFILRSVFVCETCGEEFESVEGCLKHELTCNPIETHTCTRCGKEESWGVKDSQDHVGFDKHGRWHKIELGRMGYLSGLDGCDANFELCDDCLCEVVNTFIHKEKVLNSGSNYYHPDNEDWDIE